MKKKNWHSKSYFKKEKHTSVFPGIGAVEVQGKTESKLSREELLKRFEKILYKNAKGEWIRTTGGRDLQAYHKIIEIINQHFEWREAILWLKDVVEGNFNEIGRIKSLLTPIPESVLNEIKDELARDIKGWFMRWRSEYPEENRDIDELPHQNAKNIVSILLKKVDEMKEGG